MKSKTIRMIALAGVMIMIIAALAGCGKPSTLQAYLESDETAMKEIDDMANQMNMTISVTENKLSFVYALPEEVEEESISYYKEAFEDTESSLESQMVDVVKQLEEQTGIQGITVGVDYTDSSGGKIYSATFDSEGIVK